MNNELKGKIESKIRNSIEAKMKAVNYSKTVKDYLNNAEGINNRFIPQEANLNYGGLFLDPRFINFPETGNSMKITHLAWGVHYNWITESGQQKGNSPSEYFAGVIKELKLSWSFDVDSGEPIVEIEDFVFNPEVNLKR